MRLASAMPDKDPALRAHYAKLALKRLRAYPEGKGAEIRERITAGNLALIRETSSVAWLPTEVFIELCDAILAVLGETPAREFWTDLMRDSYDHGMLKPLTMLAQFSLGRTGASRLLRTAPHAWALSTRACGTIELTGEQDAAADARGMRLRGVEIPPGILHSEGFICVFYGACRAMLDVFKSRGEIRVLEQNSTGGERSQLAFEIVFAGE
ncbi:MAG: hypothetical protein H0T76_23020 [Nannocystis sp.]|nr:hypothetical protein [Nannocystis sp.]MBA3549356.1 hypothetical protein [Nannocystis sp.]